MKIVKRLKIVRVRRTRSFDRADSLHAHCSICDREVEVLTKAQAIVLLEITAYGLDQLIADGRVHAMRTVTGSLRLCKDSLFLR